MILDKYKSIYSFYHNCMPFFYGTLLDILFESGSKNFYNRLKKELHKNGYFIYYSCYGSSYYSIKRDGYHVVCKNIGGVREFL